MRILCALAALLFCHATLTAQPATRPADGYRGIWYMNQPQKDQYKYKYSGGFATYPQQHIPIAIYAKAVNKTFFSYGGASPDGKSIENRVGVYDHATGEVSRPTLLVARPTNDTHFNPTLSLDARGHVYVFCNSHGQGTKSFLYRSDKPYSIESFTQVREDNFSYSQPWALSDGLLWLHTRYEKGQRRLFFASSADGQSWTEPKMLVHIQAGDYQISWARGSTVATAFDHHPDKVGLNARTNLYYLQTVDLGKTWTNVEGKAVDTPINSAQNAALVRDYAKEGLLVYLKDLNFDADGRPVILYLTAKSYKSGPESGPRTWRTARWTGNDWEYRDLTTSDHNYDHGSLWIEPDGTWRVIAPTDPGPQEWSTGGAIVVWTSRDRGATWKRDATLGHWNGRNQTYMRRPVNADPGFYTLWADGNALEPSASDLYIATKAGEVFRLPREMPGPTARPERVAR